MTFGIFKEPISKAQYDMAVRECDGICSLCGDWKPNGAEPDAENVFCYECENRSVLGIRQALKQNVIEVKK
jgi:hypothetical protein